MLGLALSLTGLLSRQSVVSTAVRAPTALDDAAHGNAVGALWLQTTTGLLWQAAAVTNGAAVWTPQTTPSVYPGDAVTGFSFIFGTRALRAAWANGNFCDVVRASDSTSQTIVFINSVPDTATIASFGAGTTLAVSKGYDQSGNGNDAVQATAGRRPALQVINGKVRIAFDGAMASTAAGSDQDKWLTVPAAVTMNKRAMTLAFAYQPGELTDQTASVAALVDVDASAAHSGVILLGGGAVGLPCPHVLGDFDLTQFVSGVYVAQSSPSVLIVTGGATATCSVMEGEATGITAYAAQSGTGVRIGASASTATAGYYGAIDAVMLHASSAISAPNRSTLRRSMYAAFSNPPQQRNDAVLFDGDSLMVGYGGIPEALSTGLAGYGIMQQVLPRLTRPVTAYNLSAPSQTLAGITTKIAFYHQFIYHSWARHNIYVLCWNGNEIVTGSKTGAQAYSDFQTLISTLQATAWAGGALLVHALVESSGDAYLVQKQAFNALLRAGTAAGYSIIDDSTDSRLQGFTDPAWYWQSGIYNGHPAAAAYGVRAAYEAAAINAVLRQ